jgi:hypothetical protein
MNLCTNSSPRFTAKKPEPRIKTEGAKKQCTRHAIDKVIAA